MDPTSRRRKNVAGEGNEQFESSPSSTQSPQPAKKGVQPLHFLASFVLAATVFIVLRRPEYLQSLGIFGSESDASSESGFRAVNGVNLYTKEYLAKYNGENAEMPVLLAYMGRVYDVSKGRRHYGPGGSYHFFAGKDATRAFLTGDFQNDLNDNLDGLEESLYSQIESWEETYSKSADYKEVGVLCGEFYQCIGDPEPGKPTKKLEYVQMMIDKAKTDEQREQEVYKEFPQCNSEWSQDNGGRVWCSNKSGGVERSWAGSPRLFLMQKKDGTKSTRCACVPKEKQDDPRVSPYPGCAPDAESCKMKD